MNLKLQRRYPKTRGEVPATFARRNPPLTEFGKLKWNSLRDSFGEIIKPKLVFYSTQEDHKYFWGLWVRVHHPYEPLKIQTPLCLKNVADRVRGVEHDALY